MNIEVEQENFAYHNMSREITYNGVFLGYLRKNIDGEEIVFAAGSDPEVQKVLDRWLLGRKEVQRRDREERQAREEVLFKNRQERLANEARKALGL
jgi:hypothetical protein